MSLFFPQNSAFLESIFVNEFQNIFHYSSFFYFDDPKYWNRRFLAISVDTDLTAHLEQSDQALRRCLFAAKFEYFKFLEQLP